MSYPIRTRGRPGPFKSRDSGDSGGGVIEPVTIPFSDDFERADGPLGSPWRDMHALYPTRQDAQGVRNGTATNIQHQGENYTSENPPDENTLSGWRGGAAVVTELTNGFKVTTTHGPASLALGGPMIFFTPSEEVAIGALYNSLFNYVELYVIGDEVTDFRYIDTNWCPDIAGSYELEMRVVDDEVALYLDGDLFCGPVPIPAALTRPWHGFNTDDTGDETPEESDNIESVTIDTYGGALDTYGPPNAVAGQVGAMTKFTSGSTLDVPYPTTVNADDLLLLFISNENSRSITAPAGWTTIVNGGFGVVSGLFWTRATGSETGTLGVVHSGAVSSGVGMMLALSSVSEYRPVSSFTGNLLAGVESIAPTLPQDLLGLNRIAVLVSFTNIDTPHTHPDGYTTVGQSSAGGATCSMRVSLSLQSLNGTDAPYGEIPAPTVTWTGAANAQVTTFQVYPATHA